MGDDPRVAAILRDQTFAAERVTPDALRQLVTAALTDKILHQLAATAQFRDLVGWACSSAQEHGPKSTSMMLAELGRLQNFLKPKDNWLLDHATNLLNPDFTPSVSHGDGDERAHLALVVAVSDAPVSLASVAQAAVDERTGEKARNIWIGMLLDRQPLAAALDSITDAILATDDKAVQSVDSWLRRLHRILGSLHDQLMATPDVSFHGNLNGSIKRFLTRALSRSPKPRDYDHSAKTVAVLLEFARYLIQLRVRLGVDADFYTAISHVKTWLPTGGWVRFTRNHQTAKVLRQTLLDGVLLLLEQGRPDTNLLEAHLSLAPDAASATAELAALDEQARHLPEQFRQWLRSSGKKQVAAKAPELLETDDLTIAFALIEAQDIRKQATHHLRDLTEELEITVPIHASLLRKHLEGTERLLGRIDALAEKRGLRLFGDPGEVVEFSAHAYQLPAGAGITRKVRVTSPGVEQVGRRSSRILVHALVEAIGDTRREAATLAEA